MTGPDDDPRPLCRLIDEWLADTTRPRVEPLRLERHLDDDDTPMWATWEVLDRNRRMDIDVVEGDP